MRAALNDGWGDYGGFGGYGRSVGCVDSCRVALAATACEKAAICNEDTPREWSMPGDEDIRMALKLERRTFRLYATSKAGFRRSRKYQHCHTALVALDGLAKASFWKRYNLPSNDLCNAEIV